MLPDWDVGDAVGVGLSPGFESAPEDDEAGPAGAPAVPAGMVIVVEGANIGEEGGPGTGPAPFGGLEAWSVLPDAEASGKAC